MVSADAARDWRPAYRDVKEDHFVAGFEDALKQSPPGTGSAFEDLLGRTAGALEPCDLATIYGLESTFGTDPGAYTGSTAVYGGFQMKAETARRWGLATTGDSRDGRVEWRGDQLAAVEDGTVGPDWHAADRDRELDLAENVNLKPIVEAASQYLFQLLRSLTWATFASVLTGGSLVGPVDADDPTSQRSAVRILPDGSLELFQLARQRDDEKAGDANWIRITDGPTGHTATSVYDALIREAVRYRRERDGTDDGDADLDEAVSRFRSDVRLVAALKAFVRDRDTIPGSSVGTDQLGELVEDVATPLRRDLTEYVEHVLVEDQEDGVGPPRMDVAVRKEATTEDDVRRLAYAGYNGGWIRLLAARFQAHLLDVGENGRDDLRGYASQWPTVSRFLHDEAREYAGTRMERVRPVVCGQLPPESARLNAVDFESAAEVVEIENRGNEELHLANWWLVDEAGNSVRFDEPTVLDPGETATVDVTSDSRLEKARASPALNDEGGDTVLLENDAGTVVSRFSYEIEEVDRANDGETHHVFRNTTDDSDETHWVEYDCGHRPASDNRSEPFPGVASCGHCRSWTKRNVTVTRAWTEVASTGDDGDQPTLNRDDEETIEDVEEGEFYDEWRSRT